jgi:hypothetical protein
MQLLVMQFSPTSRHSIPFWSKYPAQHPVLKLGATRHVTLERQRVNTLLFLDTSGSQCTPLGIWLLRELPPPPDR